MVFSSLILTLFPTNSIRAFIIFFPYVYMSYRNTYHRTKKEDAVLPVELLYGSRNHQ